jgi:succinoglycan biosynthesis transport protein ExoP
VFVVRAFKTSKDLVQYGGRMLRDVGSKLAGVVLNAVNLERSEYKYSYKYYKRGDYYTPTGDKPVIVSREERGAAPPGA